MNLRKLEQKLSRYFAVTGDELKIDRKTKRHQITVLEKIHGANVLITFKGAIFYEILAKKPAIRGRRF
jgi:hypothetical protein